MAVTLGSDGPLFGCDRRAFGSFCFLGSSLLIPVRNPFNPQLLISHLTNSNGCGILHSRFYGQCSRFVPSCFLQPVCFRVPSILPALCFHTLTNCFFRNPFVLIFIRIAWGCGGSSLALCLRASVAIQFAGPLFSYSYELLSPQVIYFHNHPNCPGVEGQLTLLAS